MNSQVILQRDGGEKVTGSFDKNKLLFLMSSYGRLEMTSSLAGDGIVYAVFAKRLFGVSCALINKAVTSLGAAPIFKLRPGMEIQLGLSKYKFVRPARHISRKVKITLAVCMIAIASIPLSLRFISSHPSRESLVIPSPILVIDKVDPILDEARGHLKAGRFDQARMSLEEALLISPTDIRAAEILKEIGNLVAAAEKGPVENAKWVEARTLFEKGNQKSDEGDKLEALELIEQSYKMVADDDPKPLFFKGLDEKRTGLREEVKEQVSMVKLSVSNLRDTSKKTKPRESLVQLAAVRAQLQKFIEAMPGDKDATLLSGEIDAAINLATNKWLSQAAAAEKFSGCSKAHTIYKEAWEVLEKLGLPQVRDAGEGLKRCQ